MRNKAKKYRPIRYVKDKKTGEIVPHTMDNMRFGARGQRVNTTGCYGLPNTQSIVSRLNAGKGGKRSRVRHTRFYRAMGSIPPQRVIETTRFIELDKERSKLHAKVIWGKITPAERDRFTFLTKTILSEWPEVREKMEKRDLHRIGCVMGQIKKSAK